MPRPQRGSFQTVPGPSEAMVPPRAAWELGSLAEAAKPRPQRGSFQTVPGPSEAMVRPRAAWELGSLAEAARPPRRARKFPGSPNHLRCAKMVGRPGIEPGTNRLKGGCSTTELAARYLCDGPPSADRRAATIACGCVSPALGALAAPHAGCVCDGPPSAADHKAAPTT